MAAHGRPCTLPRRSSTRERFSNATLCSASARRTVCAASDRPTAVSVLPGTRRRRGRASRQRATCLRRPISSEFLRTQHGMRGPASSTRSLRRSTRRPQGPSMRRLGSCVPFGVWLLRMSAPSTYADPRVLGTWRRALLTRPPSGVCGTAEARTGHATARTVVGCGRGLHGDDGNEPPRRRASSVEEAVEAEAQGAAPPRLVHEPVVHGLEAGQGVMSSGMAKSTALGVKDVASARPHMATRTRCRTTVGLPAVWTQRRMFQVGKPRRASGVLRRQRRVCTTDSPVEQGLEVASYATLVTSVTGGGCRTNDEGARPGSDAGSGYRWRGMLWRVWRR